MNLMQPGHQPDLHGLMGFDPVVIMWSWSLSHCGAPLPRSQVLSRD